jgi:hypothetical protein
MRITAAIAVAPIFDPDVAGSGRISKRTSIMLEEEVQLYWFAGIFPEQSFTEAGRHREAVVAADQRMVIRCFGDDFPVFVHDDFHVRPPIQRADQRRRDGERSI